VDRFPDGAVRNLTRAAGLGVNGPQHGVGIAVRDPHVHWNGTKAIFSMVVGSPTGPGDKTEYSGNYYEIDNFSIRRERQRLRAFRISQLIITRDAMLRTDGR